MCPGHQVLTKQSPAKLFLDVLSTKPRRQAVPGHASQLTPDPRAAKSKHGRHQMGRCRLRLLKLTHLPPHPTALRPVDGHSRDLCAPSLHLRRLRHLKTIGITLVLAYPRDEPINTPTTRRLLLSPPFVSSQPNNANHSPLYKRMSAIITLAIARSGLAER